MGLLVKIIRPNLNGTPRGKKSLPMLLFTSQETPYLNWATTHIILQHQHNGPWAMDLWCGKTLIQDPNLTWRSSCPPEWC